MDIEAGLWFISVVNNGSFSKAARELGESNSTVSRRVAQLERQLGTQLLIRNTRNMRLTESGSQFMELMTDLNRDYQRVLDWKNSQGELTGRFRVTAPNQFVQYPLSEWLIEFKQCYPKLSIEVVGSNEYLDFYHHRIDLAFRQGPLQDSNLMQRKLFRLEYGLFASPDWLELNQDQDNFSWLLKQSSIGIGAQGRQFPWVLKVDGQSVSHMSDINILLESPAQGVNAAVAGLGIVYTSVYDASEAVAAKQLVPVCASLWPGPIGFYLVFDESRVKSQTLKVFMEFAVKKAKTLQSFPGIVE